MSQHITRYKTENGKTRKVKEVAAKPAVKNGAAGSSPDANNSQPKQGA